MTSWPIYGIDLESEGAVLQVAVTLPQSGLKVADY